MNNKLNTFLFKYIYIFSHVISREGWEITMEAQML